MPGHTNEGTEEKDTGFPLTTGGNDRGGTGWHDRGVRAAETEFDEIYCNVGGTGWHDGGVRAGMTGVPAGMTAPPLTILRVICLFCIFWWREEQGTGWRWERHLLLGPGPSHPGPLPEGEREKPDGLSTHAGSSSLQTGRVAARQMAFPRTLGAASPHTTRAIRIDGLPTHTGSN